MAAPGIVYTVDHKLAPDRWHVASRDCAGVVNRGTHLKLGRFQFRIHGSGSLRVASDASTGGALLHSGSAGLTSLVYPVFAKGGTDPTGVWRVEVGEHVLLSDPIPLVTGDWSRPAIAGVVLHEGAWSGTTDDFQNQFGEADSWTAGLMTGGCLGSPVAFVDTVQFERGRIRARDLEPALWANFVWSTNSQFFNPVYGTRFRVQTKLVDETVTGEGSEAIAGARMELWRRYFHHGWKRVLTRTTDRKGVAHAAVTAGPSASFQWRWSKHRVVSDPVGVVTRVFLSAHIVGHPGEQPVLPHSRRIVASGRVAPGRTLVKLDLFSFDTDTDTIRTVRADRDGRWTAAFPAQPRGGYSIEAVSQTPKRLDYYDETVVIILKVR